MRRRPLIWLYCGLGQVEYPADGLLSTSSFSAYRIIGAAVTSVDFSPSCPALEVLESRCAEANNSFTAVLNELETFGRGYPNI